MIKVLIVEDMAPILKRYTNVLKRDAQIEVVASVQSGYEATLMAGMHQPDVVLMDIELETRTAGLDASEQILQQFPEMKIIILTVYEDDETVFKAFQLGVSDYMIKNAKPQDIVQCVKDAYLGRSPIRPVIAEKIRREFQRIKQSESSFLYNLQIVTQLTPTEIDVLDLLSQGHTRIEICDIRHVELSTIKTQVNSILKKFEKNSIQDVVDNLNKLQIFEALRDAKKHRKS